MLFFLFVCLMDGLRGSFVCQGVIVARVLEAGQGGVQGGVRGEVGPVFFLQGVEVPLVGVGCSQVFCWG